LPFKVFKPQTTNIPLIFCDYLLKCSGLFFSFLLSILFTSIMNFIPNTNHDVAAMLGRIGASSVSELFSSIPDTIKVDGFLQLPDGLSEMELESHVRTLTAGDVVASDCISFLGGGAYDHFVPAAVDALAADPRFVTAYTPYQAEASQGSLQLFFEYQTFVARLTGMDLSNASHYDAATACVEAILMSKAANGRNRIVVAETVSQQYRQVFETYLSYQSIELVVCPVANGSLDTAELAKLVDDKTACVVVQHPNAFGNVEQVDDISRTIHAAGGLFIAIVDPISLGILKRPVEYDADIVVKTKRIGGNLVKSASPRRYQHNSPRVAAVLRFNRQPTRHKTCLQRIANATRCVCAVNNGSMMQYSYFLSNQIL
jgi:glycine dehydrogenase subunit 1